MSATKKPAKPEKPVTLAIKVPGKSARETHKVFKDKKGDVIVDHTQRNGGKWDKINLTYSITVLWVLQIKLSLECKPFY